MKSEGSKMAKGFFAKDLENLEFIKTEELNFNTLKTYPYPQNHYQPPPFWVLPKKNLPKTG